MRFASLGSGSRGNGTLIQSGETTLLIDCGFSAREAEKRANRLNIDLKMLTALLITHEHSDHIGGVKVLASKYQLPIYATPGTAGSLPDSLSKLIEVINCHRSFTIGDIDIDPFPVPHDAREPCQFVFKNGHHRLGLLTDVGSSTAVIEQQLSGCHALMLEANHDLTMLEQGVYPEHLKKRVGGRWGHLNNQQSAALLEKIDTSQLQHLVAMHVSEKNNTPEKVKQLFSAALKRGEDWIHIADQNKGFNWKALT